MYLSLCDCRRLPTAIAAKQPYGNKKPSANSISRAVQSAFCIITEPGSSVAVCLCRSQLLPRCCYAAGSGWAGAWQTSEREPPSPSEATNKPAHHRKWFSAARSVPPGSLARSLCLRHGRPWTAASLTDRLHGIIDSLPGFREARSNSCTGKLQCCYAKTSWGRSVDWLAGWLRRRFVRSLSLSDRSRCC